MKRYILLNETVHGENICILFYPETATIIPINELLFKLLQANESGKNNFENILKENKIEKNYFLEIKNKIDNLAKTKGRELVYGLDTDTYDGLSQLKLNVSGGCNLACSYCYANYGKYNEEKTGKMTKTTVKDSINKLTSIYKGIREISFFGGEPLMNANIIEYTINYIENELGLKQKIAYSVDTNGTINIKRKFLEKLTVNVSIDGLKNYHDKFRRTRDNKPTYDTIKNNLKDIKEKIPGFKYGIQCTYTPDMLNNKVELGDIFKNLYKDFSPTQISINPTSFVENFKSDLYKFYKISIDALFDYYDKKYFLGDKSMILWAYMVLKGIKTDYICPAGTKSLTISYNGDIYPCHLLMKEEYKISNVNKFNINEIRNHLKEFSSRYGSIFKHTDGECNDCWIKNFCIGCIAKFNPPAGGHNPNFCKTTKQLFSHLLLRIAYQKKDEKRWKKFLNKIQKGSYNEN